MAPGANGFRVIDLQHLDRPESVAACVLETADGPVVVDPGPAATLPQLRAGLGSLGYRPADLAALLLTHIHLDHAGASGTLAREIPHLRVYASALGAPHLVDPSKLLASATRLYGDQMQRLWGEVAGVPEERLHPLHGGERLSLGGRSIEVAHTPGHARHHVSYYDGASGAAFVGDTAGITGPQLPIVLPVTPPPEFDLEAWLASIERILAWQPRQLVLTHYGVSPHPAEHFGALRSGLLAWSGYARETLELAGSDEDRVRAFVQKLHGWIDGKVPPEMAERYLEGAGPEACWQGLARYWRRPPEAGTPRETPIPAGS